MRVNKTNWTRNTDVTCKKTCKQLARMLPYIPIENHGEQVEVAWTCTTEVRRRMLGMASAAQIQKDKMVIWRDACTIYEGRQVHRYMKTMAHLERCMQNIRDA